MTKGKIENLICFFFLNEENLLYLFASSKEPYT